MSNLQHVYLTAHGTYPSGAWLGENAQIGVRLAFAPVLDSPAKGAIWTPTPGGTISPTYGTQSGTHGILSKTWTARVGDTGSLENFDAAAQIDAAEDMWKFLNAIKAYQYQGFQWTHVKVSAVDADGKVPVVASVYTFTAPLVGGSTGGLPPQIALALSTRANLVGRRGRGRIYLPALGSTLINPDGTMGTVPANTLRASFKTLIDDLQAQPGFSVMQPLVSIMSSDSPTVVRPVEVRSGSRVDTIQSRRRQVVETYTSTAL
jgi:hypothetical protein